MSDLCPHIQTLHIVDPSLGQGKISTICLYDSVNLYMFGQPFPPVHIKHRVIISHESMEHSQQCYHTMWTQWNRIIKNISE